MGVGKTAQALRASFRLLFAAPKTIGLFASLLLVASLDSEAQDVDAVDVRTEGEQQGSTDLRAVGHFDDDRTLDRAYFRRTQGGWFELVVSLSSMPRLIVLAKLDSVDNMGVKTLGPGTYDTVCGKGYGGFDCDGVDDAVHLTRDGVLLFQYESSSRVFYWKRGVFVSAHLSG